MSMFQRVLTIGVTLFAIILLGSNIYGAYFQDAPMVNEFMGPPAPPKAEEFVGPMPRIRIASEVKLYGMDVIDYTNTIGVHPHKDLRFSRKFINSRPIADIRKDNYGVGSSKVIPLTTYKGGKRISKATAYRLLAAVVQRMPNLKTDQDLLNLGYETLLIETGFGRDSYQRAVDRYKNYGLAQFREDTAIETIGWLKIVRPDVHKAVMGLYNDKVSLIDNLMYNAPFSVALMYQYYWRRVPDFQQVIGTEIERVILYKSEYNTRLGAATIEACLIRLEQYNQQDAVASR